MQRGLRWLFTAIALCICGGLQLMPVAANADTNPCNAKVLDQTNAHVLDVSRIESEVTKLQNGLGADVYVRAFEQAPAGSLDTYQASMVKGCANWAGPGGMTKGNLVTIMFSMDRQSAIFYGPNFHDELDDRIDGIRADMGDSFRNSDFTGGIVAALDGVRDGLSVPDEAQVPSATPSDGTHVPAGLIWALVSIAALAILIGLVFLGRRQVRSARKRKEELKAAQECAAEARDKAANEIGSLVEIDKTETVKRSVEIAKAGLNEHDKAGLDQLWSDTELAVATAVEQYNKVKDAPGSDPEQPLTQEQYEAIAQKYGEIVSFVAHANDLLTQVDARCNEIARRIEEMPVTLADLRGRAVKLSQLHDDLAADGYIISGAEQLGRLNSLLAQAEGQMGRGQNGQALDELAAAEQIATKLDSTLRRLRGIREGLEKRLQELGDDLTSLIQRLGDIETKLVEARQRYGRECSQPLAGFESATRTAVKEGLKALSAASERVSMDVQDWAGTQDALKSLNQQCGEATRNCDAFDKQLENIARLQVELPGGLNRLTQRIHDVDGQVKQFKGSQAKSRQALVSLWDEVKDLRRAMESSQPNYLDIATRCNQVDASVKQVHDRAKREHDRVVREEEAAAKRRRDEEDRRRRNSSGFGSSFAGGAAGSAFGSSFGSSSSSSGSDFGGGSSGSWGGDSGGGSSGSW